MGHWHIMGSTNTHSYAHVEAVLKKFEDYGAQLPAMDSLPESPNGYPSSVNTIPPAEAAKAMRQLPACEPTRAPQFFNSALKQELEGLQIRYARALSLLAEKIQSPQPYVRKVLETVLPHVDVDALLRKAHLNQGGAKPIVSNENNNSLKQAIPRPDYSFHQSAPKLDAQKSAPKEEVGIIGSMFRRMGFGAASAA